MKTTKEDQDNFYKISNKLKNLEKIIEEKYAKTKIRKNMIGVRSRINERFYKEREIFKRLTSLKINKAEIISGYMPNKSEVNIIPFLDDLCKKNIMYVFPS